MPQILETCYLNVKQSVTNCWGYAGAMKTPGGTKADLARNLRVLMERAGWSQADVAERTRGEVSQKTISNMLRPGSTRDGATMGNVEAVARCFGLNGWQLIMPNLIADIDSGGSLSELIENYLLLDPETRAAILRLSGKRPPPAANQD